MKSKYLTIGIFSVAVVGISIFVYTMLNRQDKGANNNPASEQSISSIDDMATWQTYFNSDYSYRLKYPKNWKVKQVNLPAENPALTKALPAVRYIVFQSPDHTYQLAFGLKRKRENILLSKRTSAAGEFVKGAPIKIDGKNVPFSYEKEGDIITSIFTNNGSDKWPSDFILGDYVIHADLYGNGENLLDPKTAPQTRIAYNILSSLTLTK